MVVASAPSPATAMPAASAADAVRVRGTLHEAELVSVSWAAGAAAFLSALCLRSAIGAICAVADAAAAFCVVFAQDAPGAALGAALLFAAVALFAEGAARFGRAATGVALGA